MYWIVFYWQAKPNFIYTLRLYYVREEGKFVSMGTAASDVPTNRYGTTSSCAAVSAIHFPGCRP